MDKTNQIPVFPNVFPYNEMLMSGRLLAKTRNWKFSYRGPILLYTSGRNESSVCRAYGLNPKDFPHSMVVGRAKLVDVRPLSKAERKILARQFNPTASNEEIRDFIRYNVTNNGFICPGIFGYFFEEIERLPEPVKINWPVGAVTVIYLPMSEAEPMLGK